MLALVVTAVATLTVVDIVATVVTKVAVLAVVVVVAMSPVVTVGQRWRYWQ